MLLRSITIQNYRNYRQETLVFHKNFNLFLGGNAQGKTNLLEAIHLISSSRPFKQQKMDEIIRFGSGESRIKGELELEDGLSEIYILLREKNKVVKLNGKVVSRSLKALRRFKVVTFLPTDLNIVKGSPTERRAYLDNLISTINPSHTIDMKNYSRVVNQRNAMLQQSLANDPTVQIWNKKIAELGAGIVNKRLELVHKLQPILEKFCLAISQREAESVEIRYDSSIPYGGEVESALVKGLEENASIDKRRGYTTVGPHRDKPEFIINGKKASRFASQGEAKTLAIALRASEISIIKQSLNINPILLLDELPAELDNDRRKFMFGLLSKFSGQIFFTATSMDDVFLNTEKKIFQIEAGKVIKSFLSA